MFVGMLVYILLISNEQICMFLFLLKSSFWISFINFVELIILNVFGKLQYSFKMLAIFVDILYAGADVQFIRGLMEYGFLCSFISPVIVGELAL
jgi:hypothetical protein